MKNQLKNLVIRNLFFPILFLCLNANSQVFVLKNDSLTNRFERVSNKFVKDLKTEILLKRNYKFKKVKEQNDSVYVVLLPFRNMDTLKEIITQKLFFKRKKKSNDYDSPDVFYAFAKNDFKEKFQKTTSRFEFGTLILPLKIRFGGAKTEKNPKRYFDFSSGLDVGLSFSGRFSSELAKIRKNIVFNLSTSSIKVNKDNTNGKIEEETNVAALTPSVGFVFEFENSVQFIAIVGIDYLAGEVGKNWTYRDQPFLGLGMGFSIFKFGEKTTDSKQ